DVRQEGASASPSTFFPARQNSTNRTCDGSSPRFIHAAKVWREMPTAAQASRGYRWRSSTSRNSACSSGVSFVGRPILHHPGGESAGAGGRTGLRGADEGRCLQGQVVL